MDMLRTFDATGLRPGIETDAAVGAASRPMPGQLSRGRAVRTPEASPDALDVAINAWVNEGGFQGRSRPTGALSILLVEDDAVIGALLAEILATLGHSVCATVATEADAIMAAARHAPDVMVVDVHLAPGNGLSAMHAVLRSTDMPHVFMTGGSLQSLPADATVLMKPFGERGLIDALNQVMARHRPMPA